MDRQVFYAELRKRGSGVFGTSISKGQIAATDAILDAAQAEGTKTIPLAFRLAVVYCGTSGRMRAGRRRWEIPAEDREDFISLCAMSFERALRRAKYLGQAPQPRPLIPAEEQSIPPAWVPPVIVERNWLSGLLDKIRSVFP